MVIIMEIVMATSSKTKTSSGFYNFFNFILCVLVDLTKWVLIT